jgi:hypothetical protein
MNQSKFTDWDDEAAALASRAATYSSVRRTVLGDGGADPIEERVSGLFRLDDLRGNCAKSEIPSECTERGLLDVTRFDLEQESNLKAWWWVHTSILKELLLEEESETEPPQQSSAVLVVLGLMEGTESGIERSWISYLSKDFGFMPDENSAEFDRLFHFLLVSSCNAAITRDNSTKAEEKAVLTTTLLEKVYDLKQYAGTPSKVPMLCPLVINFLPENDPDYFPSQARSHNETLEGKYIRVLNWSNIREAIRDVTQRLKAEGQDPFHEWMVANKSRCFQILQQQMSSSQSPIWREPPIKHFRAKDLGKEQYEELLKCYRQSITKRLNAFKAIFNNPDPQALENLLLGNGKDEVNQEPSNKTPLYWLKLQSQGNYRALLPRLIRANILYYDLDPSENYSHLITVPAWIPPDSAGLQSNSVVVYVRRQKWLGRSQKCENMEQDRVKRLLDFTAAVRSATLSTSEMSGLGRGAAKRAEEESARLGHEMSNILANAMQTIDLISHDEPKDLLELTRKLIASSLGYALVLVSSTGQYVPKDCSPWDETGAGQSLSKYINALLKFGWQVALRRRIGDRLEMRWLRANHQRFLNLLSDYPRQPIDIRVKVLPEEPSDEPITDIDRIYFKDFRDCKFHADLSPMASRFFQFLVPALHNSFRHGAPDQGTRDNEQIVAAWERLNEFQEIVIVVDTVSNQGSSIISIYNGSTDTESDVGTLYKGTGLVLKLAAESLIKDFKKQDFEWRRMTEEERQEIFPAQNYTHCSWKTSIAFQNKQLFKIV